MWGIVWKAIKVNTCKFEKYEVSKSSETQEDNNKFQSMDLQSAVLYLISDKAVLHITADEGPQTEMITNNYNYE